MTLLVVSSPCALVLSIPSAVLAAIAWGARHGILFRGGAAVEKLAEVNTVCLDKTGTLTTGELRVETSKVFRPAAKRRLCSLRFRWKNFRHIPSPAPSHATASSRKSIEFPQFESITGEGLKAKHGNEIFLGKREWVSGTPALTVLDFKLQLVRRTG